MEQNNLKRKIVYAIEKCSYNKTPVDPDAPAGNWGCWLVEHGVYGEQMQSSFCLRCGEYEWFDYQRLPNYRPSPSEPSPCKCPRLTYHL